MGKPTFPARPCGHTTRLMARTMKQKISSAIYNRKTAGDAIGAYSGVLSLSGWGVNNDGMDASRFCQYAGDPLRDGKYLMGI